jgi:nicotinamidase-related amidase
MQRTAHEHIALLIIDVQQGLFATGTPPFEAEKVIDRINALTARARQAELPVIHIQQDGTAEDNLEPFTCGWELHRDLNTGPSDLRIRKTTCDAFYETDLETQLRSRGIDSILLTGYATDFCIDATLRNALSKNFWVMVAGDAHTTNDSPVLKAELIRAHYNWAWPNCIAKTRVQVLLSGEIVF